MLVVGWRVAFRPKFGYILLHELVFYSYLSTNCDVKSRKGRKGGGGVLKGPGESRKMMKCTCALAQLRSV